MFISDEYFVKAGTRFLTYRTQGRDEAGNSLDVNLSVSSGTDEAGWRYLELDVSEFQSAMLPEPMKITTLSS